MTDQMDSKNNQTATMVTNATNAVLKVDEGTPCRESKMIKLIQSEVEAAAARETQEHYVKRLTEKQKLDMMEQGYQEQRVEIQELKSQLSASVEVKREDCKAKEATALLIVSLESQLAASTEKKRKEDQETKESVAKVIEIHKQKLDAVERGSQEQRREIQELKLRLAAEKLKGREDCNDNDFVARAVLEKSDLKTELSVTKRHLAESQDSVVACQAGTNEMKRKLTESRKSNAVSKTELEMTEWRLEVSENSITALKTEADETKRQLAESQKLLDTMKTELDEAEWELEESRKSCDYQ
jgi:hypothetical protein